MDHSEINKVNQQKLLFTCVKKTAILRKPYWNLYIGKKKRLLHDTHTLKVDLIYLIEQRPVLWDRTQDEYKNNFLKERAWRSVFRRLFKNFDENDAETQRHIALEITGKWKNLKDAFHRSLKKQSAFGRKYIYHDELLFLLKLTPYDCNFKEENEKFNMDECTEKSSQCHVPVKEGYLKRKLSPNSDETLLKVLKKGTNSIELNEDEAFFVSILPTIRKMSEEEQLEFRIGVLQIIRNIVQKRNSLQLPLQTYTNSCDIDIKPFLEYEEISVSEF